MDELLSEFLTESFENLAMLDVELVKLEQNPNDPHLLASIFRTAHTIKGTCGFLGLPRLEAVAHAAENVLGRVRDGELALTPGAVTLVLQAFDRIKFMLDRLEATEAEPRGDDTGLIDALNRAADGETETGTKAAPAPPSVADVAGDEVGAVAAAKPMAPTAQRSASSVAAQSLRVSVDLLEDLMTLVSELVLTRNQLLQMVRGDGDRRFEAPLQRLSQITSELQQGVMKTRMQPIGHAWGKLPRLIRDLSVDLGKKIELRMVGAETEIDRQALDLIKDPLTHMVRNSADHGIETIEERKAAGKSEHGTITLHAHHQGDQIVIEIADDGKGLEVAHIGRKALERGLVDGAQLEAMAPQQVMQFVFEAGFSTAAEVTSVSGRGVGMDVVRTNIEKMGGDVELASEKGKGTKVTIKIPLTVASFPALIVEAGGERFAIPQIGVVELARAGQRSEHALGMAGDAPILRLRDRLLPLVRLTHVLDLDDGTHGDSYDQACVIIVQAANGRVGLVVDRVLDTEEIVVKPVSPRPRGVSSFSGTAILRDGSVVMILDLNGVIAGLTAAPREALTTVPPNHPPAAEATSLLLFRPGDRPQRAAPLGLVTRLEQIDPAEDENSCGHAVLPYRGQLTPFTDIHADTAVPGQGKRPA